MTVSIGKLQEFAIVRPSGFRVIITEHIAKEIIRYNYLHPIIGGHIWVQGEIERDAITLVDSTILGGVGEKYIFMNQATWDIVKEEFHEKSN